MGAVSIANRALGVLDNRRVVEADVTFSASYATGGDTVAPGAVGLRAIEQVLTPSHDIRTRKPIADAASRTGKSVQLGGTSTAPTLRVYDAANTETAAATNLSGTTQRLRFIGY